MRGWRGRTRCYSRTAADKLSRGRFLNIDRHEQTVKGYIIAL